MQSITFLETREVKGFFECDILADDRIFRLFMLSPMWEPDAIISVCAGQFLACIFELKESCCFHLSSLDDEF